MPSPKKPKVFTLTSVHSATAVTNGIEQFITWANLARTGETCKPAAQTANAALQAFSEGRFDSRIGDLDLAPWAVLAWANIRGFIQGGHWHLRECQFCRRWMLVKDQRRRDRCRRPDCIRAAKRAQKQKDRDARRALDRGAMKRTF